MKGTDMVGHLYLSLIKSVIRMAAGAALVLPGDIVLAGSLLIVAEVLGVAEEFV